MRTPALIAALSLLLAPVAPAVAQPAPARLTGEHRAALRCAAAFALAAQAQAQGDAAALALPPLTARGKRYFAIVGDQVVDEAGMTREQVRDLLTADAVAIQQAGARDPDGVLSAEVKPCLARLEATVPPLKTPDLLQCSAILSLAFDEVHARDGMSPRAQDLKTLASVLSAREHEALVAAGKSGDEADAALAQAHDAMLKEAFDKAGGVEKYDIDHCYDLAKPEAKSHY
jgi:hypothetical protein